MCVAIWSFSTRMEPKCELLSSDAARYSSGVPLDLSPAANGEVEIQLVQDFSMGGFFPNFLLNLGNAEETWKLLHDQLPTLLNKELYRTARFDYIDEALPATQTASVPATAGVDTAKAE